MPRLAAVCSHCGMVNDERRRLLIAGVILAASAIVATVVVLLLASGASDRRSDAIVERGGDFTWLETAMKQCDEEAGRDAKGLHYLVIPLVDEPRDEAGWRRISINDIGNAILINAEDMMAGLRRKALRLSPDEYVFSVRNEKTRDLLTWKPSRGVRKFVVSDASEFESFRVQFQSSDASRSINWGATFVRQPGNCYWVNAILRH